MRLLMFGHKGQKRIGARIGNFVFDLSRIDPSIPTDMESFLAAGAPAFQRARSATEKGGAGFSLSEVKTLAPISSPQKIICIGLNYADHAKESRMQIPSEPVVFSKYNTAIVGPGDPIRIPPTSRKVDYEVELVAVIGKAGKDIPESQALEWVAGYTVGNDVSARDYQLEKPGGQWLLGKTFDSFAPIGPEIVTSDEIPDPHRLHISCTVNEEKVQDSCTENLIFKIENLIAYLSRIFTLKPGDLLFTGTPSGVGLGRNPQRWLKPGDTVLCEIETIGCLKNPVI